jgi:FkbM family methyltransferase
MTFISYAQNFEDVMLWRCFGDRNQGFYIDIGAEDPVMDSVTKAFYDSGWTGLNIEPSEFAFMRLKDQRPADINLQIVVAEEENFVDFWTVEDTGLSTGIESYAEKHRAAGKIISKSKQKTESLRNICHQFVSQKIDFMKIDVEGFERQVLLGADFVNYRPSLILVESTEPNSRFETHENWENILIQNDYFFCYADGLNRFYLSQEESDLKKHFKYPPNIFDDFVSASETRQKSETNKLRDELTQQRDELTQQRDLLLKSNIWRYSRVIRAVSKFVRRFIPK